MSAILNAAVGAASEPRNNAFELTIETTTANEVFLLPMEGVTSINVNWGDGSQENITTDNPTHTYATAGTYAISVTGKATRVAFDGSGSEGKLRTVTNLGSLGWTNFNGSFRDTTGLISFSSGDCDTSGVTSANLTYMFQRSGVVTIDVSTMDVSNVTNMGNGIFYDCPNLTTCDVSTWEISQTNRIDNMFRFCPLLENLDISNWDITGIVSDPIRSAIRFLDGSNNALTRTAYDKVLVNWAAQSVQSGVYIHFGDAKYSANSAAADARQTLVDTYGWIITDGGVEEAAFEFTVQTTTASESFTIPCQNVGTFDATIDWGDSTTSTITAYNDADLTHTYATAGTYQISISGKFPSISFNDSASAAKVISVDNLGTVGWKSFQNAFRGCSNMTSFTAGTCSTSEVTDMFNMFSSCSALTTLDLTAFDTENLTNMFGTFQNCTSLVNLNISTWDTSNVTTFYRAFFNCSNLATLTAPNLSVSSATTLNWMFSACSSLTQLDVSNWDTSNVSDFNGIFRNCSSLTELNVSGWDTSSATKFEGTFYNLSSVTSLDVSRFDVSGADDFDSMFDNCSSLTSLDVSNFDTSSATSMAFMFDNCSSLTSLDVSNFDTSNVTNMAYMFLGCSSLTSLDLSNFNTSSVTRMDNMFGFCHALVSINISSFNTSIVTRMDSMFQRCYALESLDVSHFDTSSVTNMGSIFFMCTGLTDIIGIENFKFENITSTLNMLHGLSFATYTPVKRLRIDRLLRTLASQTLPQNITLDLGFNKYSANGSAEAARQTLVDTYGWTIIDGGALESPLQVTIQTATNNETVTLPLTSVTSVDIDWGDSNTDTNVTTDNPTHTYATAGTYQISATGKASNINYNALDATERARLISVDNFGTMGYSGFLSAAFQNCPNLVSFTSGDCDVYSVQGVLTYFIMFSSCTSLVTADLTGMDTSAASALPRPFIGCSSLQSVDTRGGFFSTENMTDFQRLFLNCTSLENVYGIENWDTSKVQNMQSVFGFCSSLTELDLSNWNTSSATRTDTTFQSCSSLTALDVSNWDVSKVTNMSSVFTGCSSLTALDVSNWDVSKVTSMAGMFYNCSNLAKIDISNWDTSSLTGSLFRMFGNCSSLTELDLLRINTSTVTSVSQMISSTAISNAGVIADWDVSSITDGSRLLRSTSNPLTRNEYDRILLNWSAQSLQSGVSFESSPGTKYTANSASAAARQSMVDTYSWIITDSGSEDAPFQFTIQTATTNESFTIPCQNIGTFNATINWGDGSATQTITAYNDANLTHTFATAGTYQIEISGKFPNIRFFSDATSAAKVISVNNLGTMGWQRFDNAFRGCSNMTSFTPGTTSTLDVTNMSAMFDGCTSLTSLDLTAFDTSNVTDMNAMFENCQAITSIDVTSFDTSNVTDVRNMFRDCRALPSLDVTSFDTSNVTNFGGMFAVCDAMVGEGVLDVSGFDTSGSTGGSSEFFRRTQVTNLDLRNFDTSNMTTLYFAFERYNYPNEDVQGIETFDVSSIINFNTAGTFSTERYDAMLINYSGQSLQSGVDFRVGSSKYTPGGDAEAARTTLVNTYGWVITDGGPVT